MCLYPKLIKNRKYIPNKKNNGNPPTPSDPRVMMVPIGCQKCMECKKQKARQWSVRLQEEIRTNKTGQFVTLTFSDEAIKELSEEMHGLEGYALDNEIATLAVRRFLERWRKKYKVSVKHWLVTELGHNGTENIHLHGIIFNDKKPQPLTRSRTDYAKQLQQQLESIWQYGWVYLGKYVNEQTINYCVKYTTKMDLIHPNYNAKILTSPGIGNTYLKRYDAKTNRYRKDSTTDESYTTRQGRKISLPIYYRNHIYNEQEREKLWLQKLDKEERWVNGTKVSTRKGPELYYTYLKYAREKNRRLGYGDDNQDWCKMLYEHERRKLQHQKRIGTLIVDTETGEILQE